MLYSLYNILSVLVIGALSLSDSVSISNISLPEIAESGTWVWLNCVISSTDEDLEVKWVLRRAQEQLELYRWKPRKENSAVEVHHEFGNLTSCINNSVVNYHSESGIRKEVVWSVRLRVNPSMSGTYSCIVTSAREDHSVNSTMLVYSPEQELSIFHELVGYETARVRCVARGLYPQPAMLLELNHKLIPKQELRVWVVDSYSFDAESSSEIRHSGRKGDTVTCRLNLPTAGYSAMKEELLLSPRKLATLLLRVGNIAAEIRRQDCIKVLVLVKAICFITSGGFTSRLRRPRAADFRGGKFGP